jgi:hypothetical protein
MVPSRVDRARATSHPAQAGSKLRRRCGVRRKKRDQSRACADSLPPYSTALHKRFAALRLTSRPPARSNRVSEPVKPQPASFGNDSARAGSRINCCGKVECISPRSREDRRTSPGGQAQGGRLLTVDFASTPGSQYAGRTMAGAHASHRFDSLGKKRPHAVPRTVSPLMGFSKPSSIELSKRH